MLVRQGPERVRYLSVRRVRRWSLKHLVELGGRLSQPVPSPTAEELDRIHSLSEPGELHSLRFYVGIRNRRERGLSADRDVLSQALQDGVDGGCLSAPDYTDEVRFW